MPRRTKPEVKSSISCVKMSTRSKGWTILLQCPNKPTAASGPGGRWGSVVFGWRALLPPRVAFVIGCVSCNKFSHFRQKPSKKHWSHISFWCSAARARDVVVERDVERPPAGPMQRPHRRTTNEPFAAVCMIGQHCTKLLRFRSFFCFRVYSRIVLGITSYEPYMPARGY